MTANVSLNQSVHLRQPASEYLSQCYQISARLNDLIEALKMLLESFQVGIEAAHSRYSAKLRVKLRRAKKRRGIFKTKR